MARGETRKVVSDSHLRELIREQMPRYGIAVGAGAGGGGLTAEDVRDLVAGFIIAGANVTVTHNDGLDTLEIGAGGGGGITTEDAVDAVAAALTEGANIDLTYNDVANTITVAVTGVSLTGHTHAQSDITGLVAALAALQPLDADLTDLAARWSAASASGPSQLAFREDTDGGTNQIVLRPTTGAIASDKVIVLPDATTELVGNDTTHTLTNKSISGATNTLTAIAQSSVTDLTTDLGLKADKSTTLSAGTLVSSTGLGDLSAGRTINLDTTALDERVRDTVAAFLVQGANVTLTHNDGADTLTVDASGGGGGISTEDAVDAVAAALVETAPIDITYNDGANTITVAITDASTTAKGAVELATTAEATAQTDSTRAVTPDGLADRVKTSRSISTTAPLSGGGDLSADRTLSVLSASTTATGVVELATDAETITGTDTGRVTTPSNLTAWLADNVVAERIRDVVGATLTAGSNVTITPNDGSDIITIAASGGGGGLSDADYGDITVSGTGTVMTIDNDAVTYAKMQNVSATDKILGRSSGGAGDVQEITCTAFARTLLDDAAALDVRTTLDVNGIWYSWWNNGEFVPTMFDFYELGIGATDLVRLKAPDVIGTSLVTVELPSIDGTLAVVSQITDHTGDTVDAHDASAISFSPAGTIAATTVQAAIEEVAAEAGGGGVADGDKGDITVSSSGSVWEIDANAVGTTEIANDAVTYAKIQNVTATDRLLGRVTSGAGDIEEVTCTAAGRAILDDADATAQRATLGLVIGTDVQAFNADLTSLVTNWVQASASGPSTLDFHEDTDNGSNRVRLSGPASTADVTVTLPAATDTLVGRDTTDTLTNKTLTSPTLTTPVLGTPASGTLTNCTGLPVAGITASTSTALGVGSIELGHASDTTLARSGAGDITVEGNALYRAGGTDVAVTDGGTGRSTSTTAYGVIAAGTTATGAHQTISPGTSGHFLKSAGASALGAFAAIAESDVTNLVTDLAAKTDESGGFIENCSHLEYDVNVVAATGSTETLDFAAFSVHQITMDQNCTFTFSNPAPSGEATVALLELRGAFTPTFPASVDWGDATPPTYTTPSLYSIYTRDAGTTYLVSQIGKAFG